MKDVIRDTTILIAMAALVFLQGCGAGYQPSASPTPADISLQAEFETTPATTTDAASTTPNRDWANGRENGASAEGIERPQRKVIYNGQLDLV